jgi:hypothetical protein
MITIKEHFDKLGTLGDKVVGYAIIGSLCNHLIEAGEEIEDEDILTHLSAIHKIVREKQTAIMRCGVIEL